MSAFVPAKRKAAFPRDGNLEDGMDLRDYFAGQAIGGLLAGTLADGSVFSDKSAGVFARMAFDIADAMLEERKYGQ